MAGAELYGLAESDYPSFCRLVPPEDRRYMLQIPHFSQSYAAPLLRTLQAVIRAHDHAT